MLFFGTLPKKNKINDLVTIKVTKNISIAIEDCNAAIIRIIATKTHRKKAPTKIVVKLNALLFGFSILTDHCCDLKTTKAVKKPIIAQMNISKSLILFHDSCIFAHR